MVPQDDRRIRPLEDVLGLTLFERHTDGLRPTAASEPLLRHARDAARSIETVLVTQRERRRQPHVSAVIDWLVALVEVMA